MSKFGRKLGWVLAMGTASAGAAASDALCLDGQKQVNLAPQFPGVANQGDAGVCYAMTTAANFEAACYRNDGRVRNLCKSCLLADYLIGLSPELLRTRVALAADEDTNLLDGGDSLSVARSVFKSGGLPGSWPGDEEAFMAFNHHLTQQARATDWRKNLTGVRRELLGFQQSLRGRARVDQGCDVRSFRMETYPIYDYEAGALGTDVAMVAKLRAVEANARVLGGRFPSLMNASEAQIRKLLAARESAAAIAGAARLRGVSESALIEDFVLFVSTRQQLMPRHAEAHGMSAKDLAALQARLRGECARASAEIQHYLLDRLCHGVPLMASLPVEGLQEGMRREGPFNTLSRLLNNGIHAMIIQGVQPGPGGPYLIFRNSWPQSPVVRMPLAESCRFRKISTVLTPGDLAKGLRPVNLNKKGESMDMRLTPAEPPRNLGAPVPSSH